MALRGDTVRPSSASRQGTDDLDGERTIAGLLTAPVRTTPPTTPPRPAPSEPAADAPELEPLPPELIADLDAPRLVLSDGYVGPDRRRRGAWARARRATFAQRRAVLSLELLLATLIVGVVLAAAASIGLIGSSAAATRGSKTSTRLATGSLLVPLLADPPGARTSARPATTASRPATTAPAPPPVVAAPAPTTAPATPATTPAPVATAPTPTAPPAPAPPVADPTPQQLGNEALALVRYPWQRIPGYSIQFEPISAAPSPGFYGNTTFTWGQAGGTSILYVYPGETVDRLAGITAFEIGHEVDAAAVEPQGGHTQIENILGTHPASWAPDCDCAEQNFLSGWYAAAFSDYWSPGVGNWSDVAPEPTGATLAAVEPWLDPTIP
jgi:hypothetical protein